MKMIALIQIGGLILISITFILVFLWLMMPNVKNDMKKNQNIPFED